ncbi:MAG: MOSC N-terminal beta barrel domain-containing protein [Dehalococcoidia bacterium]
MTAVGRIQHIARYPVKSMRGEVLDEAQVALHGIPGDRTYTFIRERDDLRSLWPFLTGRDCPDLMRYQPEWGAGEPRPELFVVTPDGTRLGILSDELRAEVERRVGQPVRLHADYRGNKDVAYISVISMATVRALAEAAGVEPDHRRWRMNLVLDADIEPFGEREWVGRALSLGGVRLVVTEQDRRCVMTTFHPETGASTPAVLKKTGEMNDAFAGVYASVSISGKVAVGDEARLA